MAVVAAIVLAMGLAPWAGVAPAIAAAATGDVPATTDPRPPAVVLLGAPEDAALVARIAAELHALGFSLESLTVAHASDQLAAEVARALSAGTRAVIEIDGRAGRTAVSVAEPATGRVALKQVLEAPPAPTLDTVLAVRTVEFVRATLLGPPNAPAPPPAPRIASDRPPAPAVLAPARFQSAFGSGVVAAAGGLGPELVVSVHFRLRLASRLGAEWFGVAPLSDRTVTTASGSSRSASWLAGGGLYTRFPLRSRGGLEVGAGALAVWLRATGTAAPMYLGQTDTGLGAAFYGRVGGEVVISGPLSLRVDALAGDAILRPVLTLGDSGDRAAWGRAFVAVLGGINLRWF